MATNQDESLFGLYERLGGMFEERGDKVKAADAFALALYYARRLSTPGLSEQCRERIAKNNPHHIAGRESAAPLLFAQLLIRYPADQAQRLLEEHAQRLPAATKLLQMDPIPMQTPTRPAAISLASNTVYSQAITQTPVLSNELLSHQSLAWSAEMPLQTEAVAAAKPLDWRPFAAAALQHAVANARPVTPEPTAPAAETVRPSVPPPIASAPTPPLEEIPWSEIAPTSANARKSAKTSVRPSASAVLAPMESKPLPSFFPGAADPRPQKQRSSSEGSSDVPFPEHHIYDLGASTPEQPFGMLRIADDFVYPPPAAPASPTRVRRPSAPKPADPAVNFIAMLTIMVGLLAIGFFTQELWPILDRLQRHWRLTPEQTAQQEPTHRVVQTEAPETDVRSLIKPANRPPIIISIDEPPAFSEADPPMLPPASAVLGN